jgi:hypothetical protein
MSYCSSSRWNWRETLSSKDERISIDNGIWLCYTHGKLVDTDENRFTIAMLKKWREFAEFRAGWIQEHGVESPPPLHVIEGRLGFADEDLTFFELGDENRIIGAAFADCCVELV